MKKKLRSTFLLESLEARLLFSADLAPLPVDGGGSRPEVESGLEISLRPDGGGVQEADTDRQERQEVIFVDEAVDDFDQLIADLESQLEKGRQFDIVALDSDDDGIAQISAYLNQHQDVAAVHFISHGADGEVVLGNSRLNATTLDGYAEAIEGWQRSLSKDADLLFYGCNLAAGDDGQDLINSLTLLSGADVAASDDVTGSVKLGGDWELEYGKGEIETAVAVNSETQQNWNGVLNTFIINTTADTEDATPGDGIAEDASGNTSLRAAIMEANALGGANEIILDAGTYVLSLGPEGDDDAVHGDLDVTGELTITGADAATTVIDANSLDRVFHLKGNAANLTLTDLTVQGGSINNKGGGIYVDDASAQLTATRVIVTGNIADDGAGIFNNGTMTLTDVVISNNGDATTNEGGGIHNKGPATLNGVTISGNRADKGGGDGGGIHNDNTADSLSLTNVTVSGNSATEKGGGLHTQKPVTILNSTFTLNSANNGGGISNNGGTVDIKNTIVAENVASTNPDVEGTFNSQGYNLIGDKGTVTDFTTAGDQAGTAGSPIDPLLGSLWDNGGFTETHALLAGSPAIDPAGLTGAPPLDQRGFAHDLTPDIGAFEYNATNTAPTLTVTGAATVKKGTVYTLNLSASDPDGDTITSWTINWGDGTIETIPGNPSAVTHIYTQAGFTYNITVSATDVTGTYIAGDLISTSMQNDSLYWFDANTGLVNHIENLPGPGNSPVDVQVGPDGEIYVTGYGSNKIFRYNADGSFDTTFVDGSGLNGPSRIAFGPDGNLYVTNMFTNEVLRFSGVDGTSNGIAMGAFISTNLNQPDGITFGPDGNLYVGNRGTGDVLRFDGVTGALDPTFTANGPFGYMDIQFGPDGLLWVTNQSSNDIRRYSATNGAYIDTFASTPTGATDFAGIAFGPDGYVYLSDAFDNDKIIRFPIGDGSAPEPFVLSGTGGLDQPVNIIFTPAHQVMVMANNAPTVSGTYSLPSTDENTTSAAVQVSAILADASITASDPDGDTLGIAVFAKTGLGTWQYSTDGVGGWTDFGAVDPNAAVLLSETTWVRYVPDGLSGENVDFDFRAWDQSTDLASTNGTPRVGDTVPGGGTYAYSTGSASVSLTVSSVNDPPTVVTNAPLNVPEEATRTITSAYLETTDPDNSPDQIIYTLTSLPSGGWVRLNGTPLSLGQTFTQDDINNNRVTYRDDDDGETTSFQMTVSDGNTILPAFSFSINGQPINDAPVVSAPGSALNATEQIGLAIHGTGFGVSDLDEAGAGALATLTVGEGTISVVVGNSGASVDSGDGTGTVTLSGSIAQLNALLTGTSTGTITYLNNSDTPSSNTTLTVTVNDQGNTGSDPGLTGDGSSEEGNNTVTINIASVNDAPTITSFAGYGVDEDDNYRALAGISIADADAGGADVQVTLGVTNGVLLIGSTAGLTSFSGNDSASVVLVGSVIDINGAMASLSFKPNPDFAGSDNLSISVDDLGNTGDDGPKVTNKIVPMIVNPLNDPPVLGNNSLTITEGATVIFNSSMLSATDVDNPDPGLTFNISAVMGGQFERVSTGLIMTVFTQADITSGEVRFVHDGSQTAPSYNVSVTDGSASVGPTPAVINFTNINDPGTVTIDNTTPAQGDTLTASVSDPDGATGAIAYQWFRDGVAIGGATAATYITTQADVGKVITVTADYTDDLSTVESLTSAGTAAVTNVNDPGTVTIDNLTPAQGDTLTASVSDPDGASGAISYQWFSDGVAIGGATSTTYTTVQADVGSAITVTATYTDDLGAAESPTSAATAAVTNVNDTGIVTIDNLTPAQGDTLTASVSDPDGASGAISYQWFSDGVAIGGATSATYTTVQADVGSAITVTATYTDDLGAGESPTSAATAAVTNVNDAGTVSIDNLTPAQGDTLTASVSDPDGASGAISYQWFSDGVAIGGATSTTYTTVQADVGSAITVTATYTDDLGAGESPTSLATAAVTNVNDPGTVTIDNLTPAQGDTLTANVIDPDGVSGAISYQWFSDGAAIGGAVGKTYTTVQADVGTIITVTADYTDDQSTVESLTSAATAAVTNVNDNPVAVNDNLNATEDNSMTITSVTDLLGNDSDIDGDALTLSGFSQPANGMLVDNADGTLGYTPAGDFCGIDSFTYTISDGNSGTADGTAIIAIAPVGDTPQVTNVSTNAEVQSGLIFINRNASDGPEVSHFKISGITNGSLHLADGLTRIDNGDYVTVAQGQAGLRFTPAEDSTADGSFNVESSEDGVSVASQSGIATSIITVLTTAPPPAASEPSPPLAEPEPVTDEEVVEEEAEASEDVADETDVSADADNMFSVKTPQSTQVPGTAKPSLGIGASFLRGADFNGNDDKTPDRSTLLSPQTLKMLFEAQNLGELKTALGKLDITTLPPDVYELVRGSLDAVKEEMGRDILLGKTVLGSAIATSVGLSAGYVVWMLKGGSLLASVLSSLPAWQLADPLAILVGKKDDENEDDESLETIIEEGSGRDKEKKRKAAELDNLRKESVKR